MSPRTPRDPAVPVRRLTPLVLLVDDFGDAREMYAEYLVARGFNVEEAIDGHQALAKARALGPDVILMDLALPGVDGWEVTRLLKRDARTRRITILALTAHAFKGEKERALAAGCDGFIAKPCLPQEIARRIGRALAARDRGSSGGRVDSGPGR